MRLLVVSHKLCWPRESTPSGYATDGGFPLQMAALSELFAETILCVPCGERTVTAGEIPLHGENLSVVPLSMRVGTGTLRKLSLMVWLARNCITLITQMRRADGVHAPVPGDVGTVGMLLAYLLRKPLFVRYCGNWFVQTTTAEMFWKWFMERFAGGRNVMLATGGAVESPSARNPNLRWIFSTSLRDRELQVIRAREKPLEPRTRLIIICRQERGKGTDIVIESLSRILQTLPEVSLDVVGEGGALKHFKELALRMKLDEHITFHGQVNHDGVMKLLRQADVFCYPTSSSEGFPKVVLEALAQGLPVVTTRVSVLPRLIGTGCGTLLSKPTPAELAQAVIEIVSDPSQYNSMSAQAVNTARQYSLERWRDTIGELLRGAWTAQLRSDA